MLYNVRSLWGQKAKLGNSILSPPPFQPPQASGLWCWASTSYILVTPNLRLSRVWEEWPFHSAAFPSFPGQVLMAEAGARVSDCRKCALV